MICAPINGFRLVGFLLGLAAVGSLLFLARDRFHQKAIADRYESCEKAAESGVDPAECRAAIRAGIVAGRAAAACDRALQPLTEQSRFAAAQACGPGVKRLIAEHDAARGEAAAARAELARQRVDGAAAVERAERRANKQNEREAHGRTVIDTAPRDGAGRIRCDAECLRRLAV